MAAIRFTLTQELFDKFQAAMKARKLIETRGYTVELERGDKKRYIAEAIQEWIEEEKMTGRRMLEEMR